MITYYLVFYEIYDQLDLGLWRITFCLCWSLVFLAIGCFESEFACVGAIVSLPNAIQERHGTSDI